LQLISSAAEVRRTPTLARRLIEIGLIFVLLFVSAATLPPNVNEAHYLGKARHYWDPSWCAGDLFLESRDAHLVFYWSFGWITVLLPLSAAAWIGRAITWGLMAWAWWRLSWLMIPARFAALATAALFVVLVQWTHMAGEWVVGGVEAKGFAFVLLFLGLEALARGRWRRVWLYFGAAASFHVILGGWSVVAGLLAWFATRVYRGKRPAARDLSNGKSPESTAAHCPTFLAMLPALLAGFLLALPGLAPAVMLSWGTDPNVVRAANRIYVFERLPHHLVFHQFQLWLILRHGFLLLAVVALAQSRTLGMHHLRILRFVAGSMAIALTGIAIDQLLRQHSDLAASLLRFYWFRLSDVMLPLAAAFLLVLGVQRLLATRRRWGEAALTAIVLITTGAILYTHVASRIDPRPRSVSQSHPSGESRGRSYRRFQHWLKMCAWVDQHLPGDAVVLTPRYQQTFKWYAQRAEVVTWKDIPQDAAGIVAWWKAVDDLYPPRVRWRGLAKQEEEGLLEMGKKYGFKYIVVDRSRSRRLNFPRLYPVAPEQVFYEVYRVPDQVSLP
jgi:hypothetical protein